MRQTPKIQLIDQYGNRKYLNTLEREKFAIASKEMGNDVRMFCTLLYLTGCRMQEALNVTFRSIDLSMSCVTLGTLKQRRQGVYRQVPLPEGYLDDLQKVYDIKAIQKKGKKISQEKIWTFSKRTAQRRVNEVMEKADITGVKSTAKGLRHGFAIFALVEKKIPITTVQKWLGHANLETTAIYANALGIEERKLATRLWE